MYTSKKLSKLPFTGLAYLFESCFLIPQLRDFARMHDVIIFVSGKKSSNGKQLYTVCKEVNPRTYFVESAEELSAEMFEGVNSVGISGATSTPLWVTEEIRDRILEK